MTLDETLLQKLAEWRPHSNRETLSLQDPASGWVLEVAADCVDTVGARLWELTLRRATPQPLADLRAYAEQLATRATGLLETLRVLEVDLPGNAALLRSETPASRGDDLFYYELRLRDDGATTLSRYRAGHGEPRRQQIAFTLTHEVLARLIDDLSPAV